MKGHTGPHRASLDKVGWNRSKQTERGNLEDQSGPYRSRLRMEEYRRPYDELDRAIMGSIGPH